MLPEAPRPPDVQRHIAALDGVRGIAILGVVWIHIQYLGAIPEPPPRYLSLFHVAQFGWMGVDLFFVLSGFLITGILLDTKESSNFFRSFYARRTLRIFPLYYGALTALALSAPLLRRAGLGYLLPWQGAFPYYFAYLQNWMSISSPGMLGPFWTLAVEEQFYLVWPLLVYLLPRRTFVVLTTAICLLVPVGRILFLHHYGLSGFLMVNLLARMDALAWGALAAVLVRSPGALARTRPLLPWAFTAALAGILIIDFPLHEFYARTYYTEGIGFTVIAVASAAFLLMAYLSDGENGRLARVMRQPVLRSFGRCSYGIYVLHLLIVLPAEHLLPRLSWYRHSVVKGILFSLGALAACWLLAWCSFHAYEKHFLRLKKYFAPKKQNAPTPV